MIDKIISQWDANKGRLEEWFRSAHPGSYADIVKQLFTLVIYEYNVENLVVIDHGHYQGTQIFIIPEETYQPSIDEYLITYVYYGSCSGCDTLEGIREYSDDKPTEEQVKDYMSLALHLVQKLKVLGE